MFFFFNFGESIYAQMYIISDSINSQGQRCRIFTQPYSIKGKKTKAVSYVFTEKRSDISLGCELYKEENGQRINMDYFPVAAYTKDESGRMNYNSILPYISICQAGQRTVLSFECQFIVINPDRANETILETKNLYGLIMPQSIDIHNYEN